MTYSRAQRLKNRRSKVRLSKPNVLKCEKCGQMTDVLMGGCFPSASGLGWTMVSGYCSDCVKRTVSLYGGQIAY